MDKKEIKVLKSSLNEVIKNLNNSVIELGIGDFGQFPEIGKFIKQLKDIIKSVKKDSNLNDIISAVNNIKIDSNNIQLLPTLGEYKKLFSETLQKTPTPYAPKINVVEPSMPNIENINKSPNMSSIKNVNENNNTTKTNTPDNKTPNNKTPNKNTKNNISNNDNSKLLENISSTFNNIYSSVSSQTNDVLGETKTELVDPLVGITSAINPLKKEENTLSFDKTNNILSDIKTGFLGFFNKFSTNMNKSVQKGIDDSKISEQSNITNTPNSILSNNISDKTNNILSNNTSNTPNSILSNNISDKTNNILSNIKTGFFSFFNKFPNVMEKSTDDGMNNTEKILNKQVDLSEEQEKEKERNVNKEKTPTKAGFGASALNFGSGILSGITKFLGLLTGISGLVVGIGAIALITGAIKIDDIIKGLKYLKDQLAPSFHMIIKSFNKMIKALIPVFINLVKSIIPYIQKGFEYFANSIKKFIPILTKGIKKFTSSGYIDTFINIFKNLGSFFLTTGKLIGNIIVIGYNVIKIFLPALTKLFDFMLWSSNKLLSVLGFITETFNSIISNDYSSFFIIPLLITRFLSKFQMFEKPLQFLGTTIDKIFPIFGKIGNAFLKIGDSFSDIASTAEELGRPLSKIEKYILPIFSVFEKIPMIGRMFSGLRGLIGIGMKSFGFAFKFFEFLPKLFSELAWPITIIMSTIDFIKGFVNTSGGLFDKIKGGLNAVVLGLIKLPLVFLGWVGDKILGLFGVNIKGGLGSKLISSVMWLVNKTFEILLFPFKMLWDGISLILKGAGLIFDGIIWIVSNIFKIITFPFKMLWDGIKGIGSFFSNAISSIIKMGKNILPWLFKKISGFISDIGSWLIDLIPGAKWIKSLFGGKKKKEKISTIIPEKNVEKQDNTIVPFESINAKKKKEKNVSTTSNIEPKTGMSELQKNILISSKLGLKNVFTELKKKKEKNVSTTPNIEPKTGISTGVTNLEEQKAIEDYLKPASGEKPLSPKEYERQKKELMGLANPSLNSNIKNFTESKTYTSGPSTNTANNIIPSTNNTITDNITGIFDIIKNIYKLMLKNDMKKQETKAINISSSILPLINNKETSNNILPNNSSNTKGISIKAASASVGGLIEKTGLVNVHAGEVIGPLNGVRNIIQTEDKNELGSYLNKKSNNTFDLKNSTSTNKIDVNSIDKIQNDINKTKVAKQNEKMNIYKTQNDILSSSKLGMSSGFNDLKNITNKSNKSNTVNSITTNQNVSTVPTNIENLGVFLVNSGWI